MDARKSKDEDLLAQVVLKPVTDSVDIPKLYDVNARAMTIDPIIKWFDLHTERPEYETTMKALTDALNEPKYTIVKAVIPASNDTEQEQIVGFILWMNGYIELDKVDPFAPKEEQLSKEQEQQLQDLKEGTLIPVDEVVSQVNKLAQKTDKTREEQEKTERLKVGAKMFAESGNYYIRAIRGKRHCCKL